MDTWRKNVCRCCFLSSSRELVFVFRAPAYQCLATKCVMLLKPSSRGDFSAQAKTMNPSLPSSWKETEMLSASFSLSLCDSSDQAAAPIEKANRHACV